MSKLVEVLVHLKIQFSGTSICGMFKFGHHLKELDHNNNCSCMTTMQCGLKSCFSWLLPFPSCYLTPAAVVGARRRQLWQTLNFRMLCNPRISQARPQFGKRREFGEIQRERFADFFLTRRHLWVTSFCARFASFQLPATGKTLQDSRMTFSTITL